MFACLSHGLLVSNAVPFFDLSKSAIVRLDSEMVDYGGRFVRNSNMAQLFWCVGSAKRIVEMDDDTVHVTTVYPNIVLCGFHGLPIREGYVELFNSPEALDQYLGHLCATMLVSFRLARRGRGRFYNLTMPNIAKRPTDDCVAPEWEMFNYNFLPTDLEGIL